MTSSWSRGTTKSDGREHDADQDQQADKRRGPPDPGQEQAIAGRDGQGTIEHYHPGRNDQGVQQVNADEAPRTDVPLECRVRWEEVRWRMEELAVRAQGRLHQPVDREQKADHRDYQRQSPELGAKKGRPLDVRDGAERDGPIVLVVELGLVCLDRS